MTSVRKTPSVDAGESRGRALCSAMSIAAGEDPVGTAAAHELYIFLETPPPWPAQAIESHA